MWKPTSTLFENMLILVMVTKALSKVKWGLFHSDRTFYSRQNNLATQGLWTQFWYPRLAFLTWQTFTHPPESRSFDLPIFPTGILLLISLSFPAMPEFWLIKALCIQKFFQSSNIYWMSLCTSHTGK